MSFYKTCAAGLAVLISLAFSAPALAHGGGLNSEGCHNQRSNGSYHCHRATSSRAATAQAAGFSFRNCTAARTAGYRNITRGSYGYGAHLDRDNDGIACES